MTDSSDESIDDSDTGQGSPRRQGPSPGQFARQGARPEWGLAAHLVGGLAGGWVAGMLVSHARAGALLAAALSAMIAGVSSFSRDGAARRVAVVAGTAVAGGATIGFLATGHPWVAALSVAALAIVTSSAAVFGVVPALVGLVTSLGFSATLVLATALGMPENLGWAIGLTTVAAGCLAGLAYTLVIATIRPRGQASAADVVIIPWKEILESVLSLDRGARDGVRRAIPLAVGAFLIEAYGSRDAIWVFVAALAVTFPVGKSPLAASLARVGAAVLAVVALGPLSRLLSVQLLLLLATIGVVAGVTVRRSQPLLAGAASSFGAIVIVGAPAGNLGLYASRRVVDTIIGASIALASTYLLWPDDRATEHPLE